MLYIERIDMSEGIVVNKTNESHKCIICNYFYFLKVNFRFYPKVPDGCHDLMQKSFNDVAVISIKGKDGRIHFRHMNIYDTVKE